MTDYTVSKAVDISVKLASTSTLCNYVTAKLTGSDSDYADKLTTCTGCSDLDGYKIEVVTTNYHTIFTNTADRKTGGCIATATTASAVCIWTSITYYSTPNWDITGWTVGWATTTVFAAGVSATTATTVITTTALTVAAYYLAVPSTCTAAVGAATVATCALGGTTITPTITGATAVGSTSTFSWYQPDENSDGYTTTMPRFSAGEVVGWWGLDATAAASTYLLAACGTGTLSGASAIAAGAAVAFGAAALAF